MTEPLRLEDYVRRTLLARVYDVAVETPLEEMPQLSRRFRNRIWLKREDLQPVFSFKIRGAYNKVALLNREEQQKGVICASAGNHAQGLALSASKLGIRGTIVMPQTTPDIKVNAVKALGGHVVLHGDSFDEAAAFANQLAREKGYSFIHPYDDLDVIAGQGTVGMEILRQHNGPIDAIFIPVGGGGLMAGIAAYVKYLRPEIRIVAVEPEDAACLDAAMKAGERVVLPQVGLFADGVAVARIGEETFKVAQHCVDEVITCTTDEICAAIKDIFEHSRSIAEPAGALSLAGLKKYIQHTQRRRPIPDRDRLGRQHELRPLAPHLGTHRTRRKAGGHFCRDHSRKGGGIPGLLPDPGQAQHYRVQLSVCGLDGCPCLCRHPVAGG
jgi:threonine dehydratase